MVAQKCQGVEHELLSCAGAEACRTSHVYNTCTCRYYISTSTRLRPAINVNHYLLSVRRRRTSWETYKNSWRSTYFRVKLTVCKALFVSTWGQQRSAIKLAVRKHTQLLTVKPWTALLRIQWLLLGFPRKDHLILCPKRCAYYKYVKSNALLKGIPYIPHST